MSTQTINYGFTKDDINEPYDVLKVNSNLDAIDAEIKEKETQIGDKANLVTVTKTNLVAAINEVKEQTNSLVADYIRSPGYGVTTGSANIYALTLNPALAAYTAGVCVAVKINVANTGASTININGLGAKPIKDSKGNALVSGKLALNSVYTFRYDGTNFILQGEGGEYGTAINSDVLTGKTIGTETGLVSGTMPNNGAQSATITTQGGTKTIPAGYTTGGTVTASFANLSAGNIKSGVNVGGVVGTLNTGGGIQYATGTANPSSTTKSYFKTSMSQVNYTYTAVSGLAFTPNCVIVQYTTSAYIVTTMFKRIGSGTYTYSMRESLSTSSVSIVSYTGNNISTVTFGFSLPTGTSTDESSYTVTWWAYE